MYLYSARCCCDNGQRLLGEAQLLEFEKPPSTRFFLSMIAQEEAAKAFILYLVAIEAVAWTPLLLQATRNHQCKQLVGVVLEYMTPEFDEFLQRINVPIVGHNDRRFPPTVSDAMNLLWHEKIRRWKSNTWCWEVEPEYDKTALDISNGKRDRIKQSTLYVDIGINGQVSSVPNHVTKSQADEEYERADRYERCVRGLVVDGTYPAWDLEEIQQAFKELFSQ